MSHQAHPSSSSDQPRFDIYAAIHKGLRAFMADTLTRVGSTDYTDAQERQEAASHLRGLLHVCGKHLEHENEFLHAAMERRFPHSAARCAHEHAQHVAHIAVLHDSLDEALSAADEALASAWQRLYQALSRFVAENFEHMLLEEREHNAVLWAHFSDAEIIGIHDALVASIPGDEMALLFRWMLPQLSHPERVAMLGGMRQGMPDEVFMTQLDMARPLLDARSWHKLQAVFMPPASARPVFVGEMACHG